MGQKKLTLRLDEEVIKKAKKLAAKRDDSVSKMTERYFRTLTDLPDSSPETSIVSRLRGSLGEIEKEEYPEYIRKKYL